MRCGLLGEHLAHSYSPRIHALLGDASYELFEVAPQNLEAFLRSERFDGLNVTIPYKKAVLPFCSALSETAERTGSVNTILRRSDGSLYGDNTDYDGFSWLLARNGGIRKGEKAVVFGTGGAARTVREVLLAQGAEVILFSRSGEHGYDTLAAHRDAVLAVNATPVGMFPENGNRPADLSLLPSLRCVLDLIYNPARTRLLLDAEDRGIPYENGLAMLVMQAKRARELFTGQSLPEGICEEILCKLKNEQQNLILIGMPGCGKTTVGRALAKKMHRPFADADEELEKRLGCDIPTYLQTFGEEAFREKETEVLAELGKRSGFVIATGGGCVTREENYPLLHQNGKLLWLKRSLSDLPTENRPLSQATPLSLLYQQRQPLYEKFSDTVVENNSSIEEIIRRCYFEASDFERAEFEFIGHP